MSPPRILVTRSEPGASETAERLREFGYQPIIEPLFSVEAIAATLPAFDALAFTSANGVRVFAKMASRRDVPVFCVGARTADAARDAGFADVASADGDVGALVRLIGARLPANARLLHTGNEDARGDLSGQINAAGRSALFVATYRAAPVNKPGPVLAAHLSGTPGFEAVLVHSPKGAAILAGFAEAEPARATLDVAAISPAAVSPLKSLANRIEIAATPDEQALLNALRLLADLG